MPWSNIDNPVMYDRGYNDGYAGKGMRFPSNDDYLDGYYEGDHAAIQDSYDDEDYLDDLEDIYLV